jgi:hypothetical protein
MNSTSDLVNRGTNELTDWRGNILKEFRQFIKETVPEVVEEIKWRKPSNMMLGVPVWSHNGIICTGEIYKDKVKFTFANGASLGDPEGLFNASLEGKSRRAIDIHNGDKLNEIALKAIIAEAVALNLKRKA